MQREGNASNPRIMVISQLPPPTHGSTVITATLIDTLQGLNYKVEIVDRRFSRSIEEVGGFTARKLMAGVGLLFRTARAASRNEVCIFFVTNRIPSFLVDCAAQLLLLWRGARVISYVHTSGYSELAGGSRLKRLLVHRLFSGSRSVICLSPVLSTDVAPFVPHTARISFIPNPAPQTSRKRNSRGDRPVNVLFLSNYLPAKGVEDFIRVANSSYAAGHEIAFTAAGAPVSSEQLEHLRANAAPNTTVLAGVSGDEKDHLFEQADILVFPSTYRYEAQPLTIIEAMESGIPVIAYDTGAISESVVDGVCGLIVPPADIDRLTQAVYRLATDDALRARLSEGARSRYEELHSPVAYGEAWKKEIEVIAHDPNP